MTLFLFDFVGMTLPRHSNEVGRIFVQGTLRFQFLAMD